MTFFNLVAKKSVQLYTGTMVLPSSVDTDCGKLHLMADSVTNLVIPFKLPTFVLRKSLLKRPKHQTEENLVCPTTRKDSVIFVCFPVRQHHNRYCIMVLFLLHHGTVFVLTSTVICMQINFLFPKTMIVKEQVKHANNGICSFATISSLICKKIFSYK